MKDNITKAEILIEALPYVNRFRDHIIVIKYGGHAMTDEAMKSNVMKDIVLMKSVGMHPIIVHGGGPMINEMLGRLQIESQFVDGLRVTDAQTMQVVEMVLSGQVNPDIVSRLNVNGAKAVGLSGKDADLMKVKKYQAQTEAGEEIDLGYVGEITEINHRMLIDLMKDNYIPVISSIGVDESGQRYNINADFVAADIARAVNADKFILLTDTAGIFQDFSDDDSLISSLTSQEAALLQEQGVIDGGMIPKVDCCLQAIEGGVERVHIIDGRTKHSLLLELFFDEGIGTMITKA